MILQKIKTGSSLFLSDPNDIDYLVFYDSTKHNRYDLPKEDEEDYFPIDINGIDVRYKDYFFIIMTYILYQENNFEYEVNEVDYFKTIYEDNIDALHIIKERATAQYINPYANKLQWWFKGYDEYIETGKTGINEEFILNNRPKPREWSKEKEKFHIMKWFKETDYIELQASRGTISRTSEKYINYLNEYNEKLTRLKEL